MKSVSTVLIFWTSLQDLGRCPEHPVTKRVPGFQAQELEFQSTVAWIPSLWNAHVMQSWRNICCHLFEGLKCWSLSRVQLLATLWIVALQAHLSTGFLQASTLEWIAKASSRGSPWPMDQTLVSCIAGRFFTVWATRGAWSLKTPSVIQIQNNQELTLFKTGRPKLG